jgi:KTSC domain
MATEENVFDRLIEVDSSMLSAVKYESETRTLEAWFNTGQRWAYHDVSPEVFKELLEASSQGSYMRSFIIGCYSEERLSSGRKRR